MLLVNEKLALKIYYDDIKVYILRIDACKSCSCNIRPLVRQRFRLTNIVAVTFARVDA